MSTSDQQGQGPLTRKQLREIRLTGTTPVISSEEAAAAAEAAPPAPPLPPVVAPAEVGESAAAEPDAAPRSAPDADEGGSVEAKRGEAPLTRRQARELEKVRTASVPVVEAEVTEEADVEEPSETPVGADEPAEIVSGIPTFISVNEEPGDADDDDVDDEVAVAPVSASVAADAVGDVPLEAEAEAEATEEPAEQPVTDDVEAVLGLTTDGDDQAADEDVLADVGADDEPIEERPTVNSAFGEGILADASDAHAPFRPSFDELLAVGDSTGSQHSAPNALIFTPSPGEGSLSGPVASTGEILVTGSYELPQGMGSQGHALGTTDGKDIDAVLIDGELPPASSPTPIAASSAISTIKPAGEVIRPPAPEKGNRLMVTLAIIAGGLALAIGVVLVIAFTTKLI
ncbi:hypothetical protein M0722_00890 [Microbacterium sp. KSW4-16]|uniref:hypothetical protein n=1 Tax=Microbacterium TaxID=33882 RepID=UPI001038BC8E|nr:MULTISPECIES: hypothetical protein [Microbacterium]MCK8465738.1 hypothetical protein [Microbacterium aurugineum]TCJ29173.1 hypothetical protein E0W80_02875 [Microbacterium sp. PI-1]